MTLLPLELFTEVLRNVPTDYLQQTVHSLSLALPQYSHYLSHNHLFTHVNLRHSGQVLRLYLYLRAHPDNVMRIRTITLSSWSVDADILVNLVRLLPQIQEMHLCIGINFALEHLDQIFQRPMTMLKFLGLRFRPYVERATYLQFLKGAYFDSMVKLISKWPPSQITGISIVQDPVNPKFKNDFAQPLIFFSLDPFTTFVRSPLMQSVTSFRLRVPSRQVGGCLYRYPGALPNLDLLDLSTCTIFEAEIEELLIRFTTLKHLIVDDSSILRGEWREGDWAILGRTCAFVGVRRSNRRLEKIRAKALSTDGVQTVLQQQAPVRRAKRGRRGLAMPSITLREQETGRDPGVGSTIGLTRGVPQVKIIPSLPTLASLSTTTHPSINEDQHILIRREFATGWAEGLARLSAIRRRIFGLYTNGDTVVREEVNQIVDDSGLEGLADLTADDEDLIMLDGDGLLELCPCPILCFAGSRGKGVVDHAHGCGHHLDDRWNMLDLEQ